LMLVYSKKNLNKMDTVIEKKTRGRPKKVVEAPQQEPPETVEEPQQEPPETVEAPQEPLETIEEAPAPEETPKPLEPKKPRGRPKKAEAAPKAAVRMKPPPAPTAKQIAGEMIRHLEDRHYGRTQARAALYSSWLT
jgi:outer membrane biosynthesis protein TonB